MQTYFVYATCTSKESSLNADSDATIRNGLQAVIRPQPPHSTRPKKSPFFLASGKCDLIILFNKKFRFWDILQNSICCVIVQSFTQEMSRRLMTRFTVQLSFIHSYGTKIGNRKSRSGYLRPPTPSLLVCL